MCLCIPWSSGETIFFFSFASLGILRAVLNVPLRNHQQSACYEHCYWRQTRHDRKILQNLIWRLFFWCWFSLPLRSNHQLSAIKKQKSVVAGSVLLLSGPPSPSPSNYLPPLCLPFSIKMNFVVHLVRGEATTLFCFFSKYDHDGIGTREKKVAAALSIEQLFK